MMAASEVRAPEPSIRALEGRRVFFGHQSVGQNLLDAVAELARTEGARVEVVETRDAGRVKPGAVAHAVVGANGDPAGKLADFDRILRSGMADAVDVALVKFCYVDVGARTDVQGLFRRYREVLDRLRADYPRTTFVHVTVPLMTAESWPKAALKRALGRVPRGADNDARERYNALLRAAFAGREPIFDLARAESTGGDGRAVTSWPGEIRALAPEYSTDGGHLNDAGRRRAVDALLRTLDDAAAGPARSARR